MKKKNSKKNVFSVGAWEVVLVIVVLLVIAFFQGARIDSAASDDSENIAGEASRAGVRSAVQRALPGSVTNIRIPEWFPGQLVVGSAVDDIIQGSDGEDAVYGGPGNDILVGVPLAPEYRSMALSELKGQIAEHTIGSQTTEISENPSSQTIPLSTIGDYVTGGSGDDYIEGGDKDDSFAGGQGDDHITGGGGDDILSGGSDEDNVFGGSGDDHIYGGEGDDNNLQGEGGDDHVYGGEGDDNINGGSGSDTLSGGEGNDNLQDGEGTSQHDTVDGGPGDDTLTLSGTGWTQLGNGNYVNNQGTMVTATNVEVVQDGNGNVVEP